jgi:hypothetical protein
MVPMLQLILLVYSCCELASRRYVKWGSKLRLSFQLSCMRSSTALLSLSSHIRFLDLNAM